MLVAEGVVKRAKRWRREISEENYGADDMIETGLGCAEGDEVK